MPAVRPQLDVATVDAFLRQHLGAPVADVRGLRGGEICTAFAYSLAGERYVIRFAARESGFVHDRFACERFAPAGIPSPRIHQIGRFGEQAFAISPYIPDSTIWHLPAARQEALAPALVEMLDRIHQLDVSATTGYGDVDDVGMGRYPSWAAYLGAIADEDPDDYYGRWSRLYDESFLERPLCEQMLAQMIPLLSCCPRGRSLVHGDFGFDNVIVDGERITAVLDWANMKYGDFLFDVAWLSFWPSPVRYEDLFRRHYAERGRAVPQYEERLRCYTCYIGLTALRFFAHTGQRAPYSWARDRVRTLLGIGEAAGDDPHVGQ
ncbi:MAG TPA: phosphotransferase [Chloroflexota bacterium]|nr:phosphotransferase [Chloroflexota bacterium]